MILRLLLGATFALAAAGKLLDREGARRALVGFGVPSPLVAPLVVLVPAGEILAALLLIPGATARAGALLSLLLLLLFILGIGVNLMRGRRPDCHCFGQFHSAPIGYKTLLRNTLLLVAALPLILSPRPHPSLFPWAALTAALLTLAILLTYLLQQNGRLLLRIEALENRLPHQPERPLLGLPVGAPAPDFQYRDTNLTHLLNRQIPLALIFTGPDCPACRDLDKDLLKLKQNVRLTSQVIEESGESRPIAESYRYAGTPSAVLVHPDGTIASPLAAGRDAVRRLLVASAAPGPGDPVPDLTLSDLDARTVPLRSLISGPTALLFWNPDCAFCQSLLP
ncbi:MAG: DoxX family protein, partial [Acidobacteria bacterium]|nr:DoxX family protein [Acidobacteriota bacterium]